MRTPGPPDPRPRRARMFEYALVILTVAAVVALATWFLTHEITEGLGGP
ncbi:MAG TPA: hypothetical protein VFZ63_07805 [Jiangellaceae bacterium]